MIRKSSRPCVQLNTEGLYDSVSKNRPFVVKNIFLWEVRVGPLRILSSPAARSLCGCRVSLLGVQVFLRHQGKDLSPKPPGG